MDKDPMKMREEAKARQEAFAKLSPEEKYQQMMQGMQSLFRPGTKINADGEIVASEPRPAKPEPPALEEIEVVTSSPLAEGEEVTHKGHKYTATKEAFHISARDAADIDDMNDVVVEVGWHTKARLKHAQA